jgi:mono/diheme cytochrome c family protein
VRRAQPLFGALALAVLVLSGAGCGTGGKATAGDQQNGAKLFTSKCAGCHVMAAAGSHGTTGPNLDDLKPSEPIVKHQVEVGGGVMPAFKGTLTPEQIDAVAKYVATSAGK